MTVDETNITPLMATNDIVTYADSDGTLEFVKTIQGNSIQLLSEKIVQVCIGVTVQVMMLNMNHI